MHDVGEGRLCGHRLCGQARRVGGDVEPEVRRRSHTRHPGRAGRGQLEQGTELIGGILFPPVLGSEYRSIAM